MSDDRFKKIYAGDIKRMLRSSFPDRVKVTIDGEKRELRPQELKDMLRGMVKNGLSFDQIDKRLEKMGIRGDQWKRRGEIMNILKERKLGKPVQSAPNTKLQQREELKKRIFAGLRNGQISPPGVGLVNPPQTPPARPPLAPPPRIPR